MTRTRLYGELNPGHRLPAADPLEHEPRVEPAAGVLPAASGTGARLPCTSRDGVYLAAPRALSLGPGGWCCPSGNRLVGDGVTHLHEKALVTSPAGDLAAARGTRAPARRPARVRRR